MEQQHLVQKYIFDVGFDSESKSFEFQDRVAVYIKERLLNLTDHVFTEISEGQELGIEKLSIDLGTFPLENFDNDFYQLFKSRLSERLKLLLAGTTTPSSFEEKVEYISKQQSGLNILEYFLLHGVLPWSAAKNDPDFSIHKLVIHSLEENPAQVRVLISSLLPQEEIRVRMIRQFEDAGLWMILKLWLSDEMEKVKKFYLELSEIYIQKPFIKKYFSEFRELVWKFIFKEAVLSKRYKFDEQVWLERFISFVSVETGSTLENVVKTVDSYVNDIGVTGKKIKVKSSFQKAISDLMKEKGIPLSKGLPLSKDLKKPSFPQKLQEEKVEFEEFREEQIAKRKDYLIRLLKILQLGYHQEEFKLQQEQIEKGENIIKEFANLYPSVLKKAFADSGFDIKNFISQQIVLRFSEEVQAVILDKIVNIEKKKLDVIRNETVMKALVALLKTGSFPYSVLPFYLKKTELNELFVDLYKIQKKELHKYIKKSVIAKSGNKLKLLEINKLLSDKTLKLLFTDFPDAILNESDVKPCVKKGGSSIKSVKLKDLKTVESFINFIQTLFKEKSLPAEAGFTVSELVEKFYSEFKEAASVYFTSLETDKIQVIQKAISPSLAKVITKGRDELTQAFKEIKEKPSTLFKDDKKDPVYNFKEPQNDEPIYINNAGLVIFHPYLSRFFNMFQLLEKRAFKDEYSAHKAVYLLQYLANKGLNNEEHELVLNKLLCGIDLKVPLIRGIEITEEDKNTCESLIEGVIQNWTILKKTSNDNFRASFVMREGRLLLSPREWTLKVEERGYDILVEKLPWSISMIKLAWMKNMINVTWK